VKGEELQTNLLQASKRIPANSSVPDEVFGILLARSAGDAITRSISIADARALLNQLKDVDARHKAHRSAD
jgi:hypothetical protein